MTCTIYYRLSSKADSPAAVKQQLEYLRQRAKALPFGSVSDLVDLNSKEWKKAAEDTRLYGGLYVLNQLRINPASETTLVFAVHSGRGCGWAVLGLERCSDAGDWCWDNSLALEAEDPTPLRSHLLLIRLLDHAEALGFHVEVDDESGYWRERNLRQLADSLRINLTEETEARVLLFRSCLWPRPVLVPKKATV